MFDGKVGSGRQVSYGGRKGKASERNTRDIVDTARKQREARAVERARNKSCIVIQCRVRSKFVRRAVFREFRGLFDTLLSSAMDKQPSAPVLLQLLQLLPVFFDVVADAERIFALCQLLRTTISSASKVPKELDTDRSPAAVIILSTLLGAGSRPYLKSSLYEAHNLPLYRWTRLTSLATLYLVSVICGNSGATVDSIMPSIDTSIGNGAQSTSSSSSARAIPMDAAVVAQQMDGVLALLQLYPSNRSTYPKDCSIGISNNNDSSGNYYHHRILAATLALLQSECACQAVRRLEIHSAANMNSESAATSASGKDVCWNERLSQSLLPRVLSVLKQNISLAISSIDSLLVSAPIDVGDSNTGTTTTTTTIPSRGSPQEEQLLLLEPYRHRAAMHVAKYLLTKPPTTVATMSSMSSLSSDRRTASEGATATTTSSTSSNGCLVCRSEDWKLILRECLPPLQNQQRPAYAALEVLNLLSNFIQVLKGTESAALIDSTSDGTEVATGSIASLDKFLCDFNETPPESAMNIRSESHESSYASALSLGESFVHAVSQSLFQLTAPIPVISSSTVSSSSGNPKNTDMFPLQWMAHELLYEGDSRLAMNAPNSPPGTSKHSVKKRTYSNAGDEEGEEGVLMDVSSTSPRSSSQAAASTSLSAVVEDELAVDFHLASGWKKLEYRIASQQCHLIQQEEKHLLRQQPQWLGSLPIARSNSGSGGRFLLPNRNGRGSHYYDWRASLASLATLYEFFVDKTVVTKLLMSIGQRAPILLRSNSRSTAGENKALPVSVPMDVETNSTTPLPIPPVPEVALTGVPSATSFSKSGTSAAVDDDAGPTAVVVDLSEEIILIYTRLLLAFPSDVIPAPSATLDTAECRPFSQSSKFNLLNTMAFASSSSSSSTSISRGAGESTSNSRRTASSSGPEKILFIRNLWSYLCRKYGNGNDGGLLEILTRTEEAAFLRHPQFLQFQRQQPSEQEVQASSSSSSSSGGGAGAGAGFGNAQPQHSSTPLYVTVRKYETLLSSLYLFCSVLNQLLLAVDDEELLQQERVMSVTELKLLMGFLKKWLFKMYWLEPLFDMNTSFADIPELVVPSHSSPASGSAAVVMESTATPLAADSWNSGHYSLFLKLHCQMAATRLFNHLCVRNERRNFLLQAEDWQWSALSTFDLALDDPNAPSSGNAGSASSSASGAGGSSSSSIPASVANVEEITVKNVKVKSVLTFIPQVIPFKQRVSVLQALLETDRRNYNSTASRFTNNNQFMGFGGGPMTRIRVHRDQIVQDSFRELSALGHRMKGLIQVEFVNDQGMQEAGIDGGGLFKEFMDSFAKSALSPDFGLFSPTSHQLLTPNPASSQECVVTTAEASREHHHDNNTHNEGNSKQSARSHLQYFNFVGRILGKALYEHILVESEFSGGFLNVLLGRTNSLDDLYLLDEQLYRSLMQLKHYANDGGDVESLELFFETARAAPSSSSSSSSSSSTTATATAPVMVELVPGGSQLRVTRANVHAYIHRLAHFKQNVETREQCRAVLTGFRTLVPVEWIRMFSTGELQLLISGDARKIDLGDMQAHVHYGSGYHPSQPYIQAFWQIVGDMSAEDQGNLLRFVTSCSRQPLLGFAELNPTFCIQKIPAYASQYTGLEPPPPGEVPRLPSAATCMNLLKLPQYDSIQTLREKLLYAIRSKSGFELS